MVTKKSCFNNADEYLPIFSFYLTLYVWTILTPLKTDFSGQGPWYSVIAYDACVRLCLHSWARGCMEAPVFLDNECALLRDAFKWVSSFSCIVLWALTEYNEFGQRTKPIAFYVDLV